MLLSLAAGVVCIGAYRLVIATLVRMSVLAAELKMRTGI
jgi:hypothetical protein